MSYNKPDFKGMLFRILTIGLIHIMVWSCVPIPALAEVVETVQDGTSTIMVHDDIEEAITAEPEETPNDSSEQKSQPLDELGQDGILVAQSSNEDWMADSYTVLVLDDSGSMSGSPASAQRQAAEQFLRKLLGSHGDHRVAVVRYESSARVLVDFTGDTSTAVGSLNLRSSGGTNTSDALQTANSLFEGAPSNITRNIVLCSDGLPQSGSSLSTGPYTYSDYGEYRYANGVYDVASTLKQSGVHIYTLGFFHSLSGSKLDFARRFMSDIQNSGYYDVRDIGDFGLIADNIAATIAVVGETEEVSYFTLSKRNYYSSNSAKGKVTENDIQQGARDLDNAIDTLLLAMKNSTDEQMRNRLKEVGINTDHTSVLKKLDDTLFGFDPQMEKDKKAKEAFFEVYSEYLDTIVYDDRFMEKVDVTDPQPQVVGYNLIKSIRNTMNFTNTTKNINGYEVDLYAFSINKGSTGTITVRKVSSGATYDVVSATEPEKMTEILNQYVSELKEMCKDALAASLRAVCTELDDDLGISRWAEKSFKNAFRRWFNKGVKYLEEHGFGNVFTICDRIYQAYDEVIWPLTYVFEEDPEKVLGILKKRAEKLSNLDLESDNITDFAVSKALDGVKKAKNKLIERITSYTDKADSTGVMSFVITNVCCPVDVKVRDSSGTEIASIVNGIASSSGRVSVSVVDDMKTIISPLGMGITLDILGTDEGVVNCTTEQVIGGIPTGRASWYDIPVNEGMVFTKKLSGGRITSENPGVLDTEQGSIPPTEWLSFDDANSYVDVTVSSDEGGLVSGSGSYPRGEIVSVTATPSDEFHGFDGWYNGNEFISSDVNYSFVAREDTNITAKFASIRAYDYTWSSLLSKDYDSNCALRVRKNPKGTSDIVIAMAGMENDMPTQVILQICDKKTQHLSEITRKTSIENDCCAVVEDIDLSNAQYVRIVSSKSKSIGAVYQIAENNKPALYEKDGWKSLPDGSKCYAKNGRLVTGWMDLGSSKYWFHPYGSMASSWTDVTDSAGKTFHYYFNPKSGNLVRNTWFEIDGYKYYFRPSGNLATGWATISDNGVDKKYYFDDSGHLVTGWRNVEVNGKDMRYYFRPSGAMATGWATIDGQTYWFRPSGNMATGFATVDNGSKHYFDENGHMVTGWLTLGANTYYFRSSGAMQTGKATIDGAACTFSQSGVLMNGTVEPTGISFTQDEIEIEVGESYAADLTVYPVCASKDGVTWTSSDSNVAEVSQGTIRAKASGLTTVTATTRRGLSASFTVTVKPKIPSVEQVTLSSGKVFLTQGKEASINAEVLPTNSPNKTLQWSSSNPSVAAVDANGQVKALKAGCATISATAINGITGSLTIRVSGNKGFECLAHLTGQTGSTITDYELVDTSSWQADSKFTKYAPISPRNLYLISYWDVELFSNSIFTFTFRRKGSSFDDAVRSVPIYSSANINRLTTGMISLYATSVESAFSGLYGEYDVYVDIMLINGQSMYSMSATDEEPLHVNISTIW